MIDERTATRLSWSRASTLCVYGLEYGMRVCCFAARGKVDFGGRVGKGIGSRVQDSSWRQLSLVFRVSGCRLFLVALWVGLRI